MYVYTAGVIVASIRITRDTNRTTLKLNRRATEFSFCQPVVQVKRARYNHLLPVPTKKFSKPRTILWVDFCADMWFCFNYRGARLCDFVCDLTAAIITVQWSLLFLDGNFLRWRCWVCKVGGVVDVCCTTVGKFGCYKRGFGAADRN